MAVAVPSVAVPWLHRARAAVERVRTASAARVRRSSRVARARAGYAAGVASSAWGVGVVFGFGWALILGGVACSVSFLLLYPVDEPAP